MAEIVKTEFLGVDAQGNLTDDASKAVEGELYTYYDDGTVGFAIVYRDESAPRPGPSVNAA